jgi:hypothetical protein
VLNYPLGGVRRKNFSYFDIKSSRASDNLDELDDVLLTTDNPCWRRKKEISKYKSRYPWLVEVECFEGPSRVPKIEHMLLGT